MLAKVIGLFLGLYISAVSATPTVVTPNAPALLPRVTPASNSCGTSGPWQWRLCDLGQGIRTWFEQCSGVSGPLSSGECPANNICQNIHDGTNLSIECVNQQPPGTSAARRTPKDPMIGTSAATFTGDTLFHFSVTVEDNMNASVAAFILSKDKGTGIEGDDIEYYMMVAGDFEGRIAGTETIVCNGQLSQCRPTGKYRFSKGDRIDFTGMMAKSPRAGSLTYTIWPSD